MSTIPKSFLVFSDFKMQVQTEDLLQLIYSQCSCNDYECVQEWNDLNQYAQNILIQGEQQAIEELSSYIRGRYLTQEVFAPTQIYNSGTTYFGTNLVFYNADLYTGSTQYNIGDQFAYKGIIYSANTTITTGSTNPITGATYITEQDALYYANLPAPRYDQNQSYPKGTVVWFEDNFYQAKQDVQGKTPATSQNLELRYGIPSAQEYLGYYSIDFDIQPNMLPNINTNFWTLYNGPIGWFTGTTYYFSGIDPTQNTTYWTKGDNRNPQVVMYLIDILLYHLHSRINPRNIPELRNIRYDGNGPMQIGGAIGWLKNVQKGKVSLALNEIQPTQGLAIRFGSYPKLNNSF